MLFEYSVHDDKDAIFTLVVLRLCILLHRFLRVDYLDLADLRFWSGRTNKTERLFL